MARSARADAVILAHRDFVVLVLGVVVVLAWVMWRA